MMGNYGVAPIGALLMGWVIDLTSGRIAMTVGGFGALAAATIVLVAMRRAREP